jgi:hypothetical protein
VKNLPVKTCLSVLEFSFIIEKKNLVDVLSDHNLASLGDAFVNFVSSLASSEKMRKPVGLRVDSFTLSTALKKADLRKFLPSRTDRHKQADSAEALIVYSWLTGKITLKEILNFFEKEENNIAAFSLILKTIVKRLS